MGEKGAVVLDLFIDFIALLAHCRVVASMWVTNISVTPDKRAG